MSHLVTSRLEKRIGMDSLLEKVTLYDFVGYLVPGTLATVLGCGLMDIGLDSMFYNGEWYKFILLLVIGYCVGVAISFWAGKVLKVLKWSFDLVDKLFKKIKKLFDKEENGGELSKEESILKERVMECLKSELQLDEVDLNDDITTYYGYIFAQIQIDTKYKRVHNYASMQLFCSNMLVVLLLSMVCSAIAKSGLLFVVLVAMFIALGKQALRFRQRKDFYVMSWFLDSRKELKMKPKKKQKKEND